MLELGDAAAAEHYNIGKYLAAIGIDRLIAVGPLSRHTAQGAADNGCPSVQTADTNAQAYALLKDTITEGETLLVKGSRGMHTDEIVNNVQCAMCNVQ